MPGGFFLSIWNGACTRSKWQHFKITNYTRWSPSPPLIDWTLVTFWRQKQVIHESCFSLALQTWTESTLIHLHAHWDVLSSTCSGRGCLKVIYRPFDSSDTYCLLNIFFLLYAIDFSCTPQHLPLEVNTYNKKQLLKVTRILKAPSSSFYLTLCSYLYDRFFSKPCFSLPNCHILTLHLKIIQTQCKERATPQLLSRVIIPISEVTCSDICSSSSWWGEDRIKLLNNTNKNVPITQNKRWDREFQCINLLKLIHALGNT